uniref:WAP domain-containing protein n=1 Tax=Chelydra serpentina TaxID=8475 RepID=A0A8C3XRI3_CHESE
MHVFLAVKPRTCPVVTVRCKMLNPPNRCESDNCDCPGPMKCCMSVCGKECLQPNQGTTLGQYF